MSAIRERGNPMLKRAALLLVLAGLPASAQFVIAGDPPRGSTKHGPDCSEGWPTGMTQATLKNAGILRNEDIDFKQSKTVRLASEQISKDLWHQVYLVTFHKKAGGDLKAIAVHDASNEECSMTGVKIFVVSGEFGSQ